MKIKKILSIVISSIVFLGVLFAIKYSDPIKSLFYKKLYEIGFKVEEIYINELSFFSVEEIIDKLSFSHGDSIMEVDLKKNKTILEESFWIEKVEISIDFPNKVNVIIHEVIPEFIWYNDDQYFALDSFGKILKKIEIEDLIKFNNFIILQGQNSKSYVQNLLTFIKDNKVLYDAITHVEWVSDRRWNIKFTNGLIVKLPQINPVSAWEHFISLHKRIDFFRNKVESIDLRVEDKIFIELDLKKPINKNLLNIL